MKPNLEVLFRHSAFCDPIFFKMSQLTLFQIFPQFYFLFFKLSSDIIEKSHFFELTVREPPPPYKGPDCPALSPECKVPLTVHLPPH